MTDPRDSRSKAEASHRLAELAKTPRARELFRQLAEEYEGRAQSQQDEPAEAAPPLAPAPPSDEWLANLKALREDS